MGWCAEFGCRIRDGCDHPMVAGRKACTCPECAVVCKGRFNGCPEVWAAGPRTGKKPVLKVASILDPPAPSAPRVVPVVPVVPPPPDERVTAALDAIRHDVEGVRVDLNNTILGVKQLRDAVDDMGRTASVSIESLRQELASVTQLLAQQQATLHKLLESHAAQSGSTAGTRSSYENLVAERRSRMAASGAAAAAATDDNGYGHLGPVRRGLLPHIQRALHQTAPDPNPPTSAPDQHEADRQ